MAKKKKKAAKGKARAKKLSVKKRPVKDIDARAGKSVKGGTIGATRAMNFSTGPLTQSKIESSLSQKFQ